MKGLTGLIVAGVLGILGLALNWFYLQQKASSLEMVSLLGIKSGTAIETGDTFVEAHFVPVNVPERYSQHLTDFVYLWQDRDTVIGIKATQEYLGGELLYKQDYRTPQVSLELADDELLLPIAVTERSPLIEPGDDVSFWIPSTELQSEDPGELLGPFRVGAIGNQVGSGNVMRAYRVPHLQANQLGIIVKVEGGQFEQPVQTLLDRLRKAEGRSVKVLLHSRDDS